jgi:hypothetical protein
MLLLRLRGLERCQLVLRSGRRLLKSGVLLVAARGLKKVL